MTDHKTHFPNIIWDNNEKRYYNKATDIFLSNDDVAYYNLREPKHIKSITKDPNYFKGAKAKLVNTCISCVQDIELIVIESDYQAYLSGRNVKDAFPYLTEGQREILISGLCDDCFENLF